MGRYRSGESFSRNGYGNSKQDEVGRTIYNRVDKLLESRWKLLCPFDVVENPTRDLFVYGMRPDERAAWNLLSNNKNFATSVFGLAYFDIRNEKAGYLIRVYTPHPVVRWPVPWENLPEQLMEKVHHWMLQSRAYRDEYFEIRDKVKELVRFCTTPGQIERVWPQLMGFMPDETKDDRFSKKARSPYPEGIFDWIKKPEGGYEPPVIKEEWRAETLAWYDTAIAESLILPLYERPEGAPAYPDIEDLDC